MKTAALLSSACVALAFASAPAWAGDDAAAAKPANEAAKDKQDQQDKAAANGDIVVTGVFHATAIERSPISVNVVTTQQIQEQASVSTADLLRNVPGVFVNSSLGEIRNVVFSRGISANSLDAASGYYYVSLQEDGMPTDLITASNYGPDYFQREDLMLSRLEGLRGGTAVVTGPNAPGGIFNYISRTGKSDPGFEISGKFGLEGDGKNPYYRIDGYAGGRLGPDLYYAVGGFWRTDRGAHDPGYAMNKGGQIRGNILWEYDGGHLLFTAKYLNDRNDWNEFTPAIGGVNIAPGFTNTSSDLPPANAAHCFPDAGTGNNECWNPTNLVHSRSYSFGLTLKQSLTSAITFENKAKYSHNQADWNTGAVISAVNAADLITGAVEGYFSAGPGFVNYTNTNTGAPALSICVFICSGPTTGPFVITSNNLPNQNVLAGGVFTQVAFVQHYRSNQFEDQAQFNVDLGTHHFALGGFAGLAKLSDTAGQGGIGISTLTNQPQMLIGSFTSVITGQTYPFTDPSGFTGEGNAIGPDYAGSQTQLSAYFGDTWNPTPQLTIDLGGRYESINYSIFNQTFNSVSPSLPATATSTPFFASGVSTYGPKLQTRRDYSYFNYSGSVAYQFNSGFDAYVRFTRGKKAPDFGTIASINTPAQIAQDFEQPQVITQIEVGLKYHQPHFDIQLFPFYSHLTNINTPQVFTYGPGTPHAGQFYTPTPIPGQIKTYGIEMELNAKLASTLGARANLTLQNPRSSNFGAYTQGPKADGTDDTATIAPEGYAENNPRIMGRVSLEWKPVPAVTMFGSVNYMGKRAANEFNAFFLPAYTTVDLGGSWNITKQIKAQFNVSNLFNKAGVLEWSQSGGFLQSLNREGLLPSQYSASALYPIVPVQARAFYWTVSAKF